MVVPTPFANINPTISSNIHQALSEDPWHAEILQETHKIRNNIRLILGAVAEVKTVLHKLGAAGAHHIDRWKRIETNLFHALQQTRIACESVQPHVDAFSNSATGYLNDIIPLGTRLRNLQQSAQNLRNEIHVFLIVWKDDSNQASQTTTSYCMESTLTQLTMKLEPFLKVFNLLHQQIASILEQFRYTAASIDSHDSWGKNPFSLSQKHKPTKFSYDLEKEAKTSDGEMMRKEKETECDKIEEYLVNELRTKKNTAARMDVVQENETKKNSRKRKEDDGKRRLRGNQESKQ
ncbi:hypothetical protein C8Q75DRAFT_735361 [Abortiporus biennis]|nr:hypothetical protein C8Q75DRAFT_735361 [Abortiporus biennis]